MTINFKELVLNFQELGIRKGDVLLVHSSFKSFGGVKGGPQTVIDALKYILSEEGTLIVPTFNYDFCDGVPFDIKKTPSKMGIISELIRNDKDSKRSPDPVFSFSMFGKQRNYLANLKSKHSFGPDSIFAKLRELNAKIMIIGLKYNESMTFFHHIEETIGCDYRFLKKFEGKITNYDGIEKNGEIILFVRDIEKGIQNDVDKMGTILEKEGIIMKRKIGNSEVKLMDVNDVYQRTIEEMKRNSHVLIRIEKD